MCVPTPLDQEIVNTFIANQKILSKRKDIKEIFRILGSNRKK